MLPRWIFDRKYGKAAFGPFARHWLTQELSNLRMRTPDEEIIPNISLTERARALDEWCGTGPQAQSPTGSARPEGDENAPGYMSTSQCTGVCRKHAPASKSPCSRTLSRDQLRRGLAIALTHPTSCHGLRHWWITEFQLGCVKPMLSKLAHPEAQKKLHSARLHQHGRQTATTPASPSGRCGGNSLPQYIR